MWKAGIIPRTGKTDYLHDHITKKKDNVFQDDALIKCHPKRKKFKDKNIMPCSQTDVVTECQVTHWQTKWILRWPVSGHLHTSDAPAHLIPVSIEKYLFLKKRVTCNVVSWIESQNNERILVEKWWNLNIVCSLINSDCTNVNFLALTNAPCYIKC